LTVVGTGIRVGAHVTAETIAAIKRAQQVFFLSADALSLHWLRELNPTAESLHGFYAVGKPRTQTYQDIVAYVLAAVRSGLDVCLAVYGHPGVFAFPTHESVRRARAEGYPATMYAAVSAEDCLFADLGVDPGDGGCQSFEATDFLLHRRVFDPRSGLIIWQIGVIGVNVMREGGGPWNRDGLAALTEVLAPHYPAEHEVVVYKAAVYQICEPEIERISLAQLAGAPIPTLSTLYVPPAGSATVDPAMARRLGFAEEVAAGASAG
jgi:uncharacterized protein YabN with tetrapyrrole methylase and pyrophosphatase domain